MPYDSDYIFSVIDNTASKFGIDPAVFRQFAHIESGFNPNAGAGRKYVGLFQIGRDEAAETGISNRLNPLQNAIAAAKLYQRNRAYLTQHLGREPTPGETYLAHQQGDAGAVALLTHPGENVVDVLAPFYSSRKAAADEIAHNGGNPDWTAGQFANHWTSKFSSLQGVDAYENGIVPLPNQDVGREVVKPGGLEPITTADVGKSVDGVQTPSPDIGREIVKSSGLDPITTDDVQKSVQGVGPSSNGGFSHGFGNVLSSIGDALLEGANSIKVPDLKQVPAVSPVDQFDRDLAALRNAQASGPEYDI